jgi:hypothetical protein
VKAFDSLAPAKLALFGFPSVSLASPPLRCAKRLASRRDTPTISAEDAPRRASSGRCNSENEQTDSPITLEIDLSARS